ncbi:MAG: hypothetical protein ACTSV2_06200 [Candidatus Thorarchaeota archaeon]
MGPKHTISFAIAVIVLLLAVPVHAQDDVVIVNVGFRELQIVPERTDGLVTQDTPFSSDPVLVELVTDNDTIFWEGIGQYNAAFTVDTTSSTFSFVQINETGFYQTNIGLSTDNISLQWLSQLDSAITSNFSTVVENATDFFANDNHYWGLCEEIVVLPGSLVNLAETYVWRFLFRLVAEGEHWTLLLNSSGELLSSSVVNIPCQSCTDWTSIIALGSLIGTVAIFAVLIYINNRRVKGLVAQ